MFEDLFKKPTSIDFIEKRRVEFIACNKCSRHFRFYCTDIIMGSRINFPYRVVASPCPFCDNYVEIIYER